MDLKVKEKYQPAPTDDVVTQETQVRGLNKDHGDGVSESGSSNASATWYANHQVTSLATTLEPLDEVQIKQHLDMVEICLCWERSNRYSLYNKNGDQIFYTYEAAQCYARQCYGSLREFTMITTDNDDNRLLYLQRPVRCSSRCCYACCCLQELSIVVPPKETIGRIHEIWSCCTPQYEVVDREENVKFQLRGECCHCRLCHSINFIVLNTSGTEVAHISKQWGGCSLKTLIGASNNFKIKFVSDLTGEEKVTILGSSFLLDFNYFERHGKCY